MGLKFTDTGFQARLLATQKQMEHLQKQMPFTVRQALQRGGEIILEKARYYCPVETGRLRTHSGVSLPEGDELIRVEITFDMAYAVFVHEDVSKNHASPTRAKFLELAVRETKSEVSWAIGTAVKSGFGTVPAFDRGRSLNPAPPAVQAETRKAVRQMGKRLVRGVAVPRRPRTMRD
jgi:hypothetical protein